jgi:hypothetical protein
MLDDDANYTHTDTHAEIVYMTEPANYSLLVTANDSIVRNVTASLTYAGDVIPLALHTNASGNWYFQANHTILYNASINEPQSVDVSWNFSLLLDTYNESVLVPFTQTIQPQTLINFTVRDERTGDLYRVNGTLNTQLEISLTNGSSIQYSFSTLNVSNVSLSIPAQYNYMKVTVIHSSGSYTRTLIPSWSEFVGGVIFYMVDLNTDTVVERILNIVDLTGEFSHGIVRARRAVSGVSRDIIEQRFDIGARAVLYLMTNEVYTLSLENNNGETVVIGNLIADTAGEQTIIVPNVEFIPSNRIENFVSWGYNYTRELEIIRLFYNDSAQQTQYFQWELFNGTNTSQLLTNFSEISNSTIWFTYSGFGNSSLLSKLYFRHALSADPIIQVLAFGMSDLPPVTLAGLLPVSDEAQTKAYISLLFLLCWAALFSYRFSGWGLMSTLAWIVILKMIDWLPISTVWLSVIGVMALLGFLFVTMRR